MAKAAKSKPPRAMVERGKGGRLSPIGPFDAALISQARPGAVFELMPRAKRSNPQQGLYWLVLQHVVSATDAWPEPEYLHDQLVRELGYVREVFNPMTGVLEILRDSTAFEEMEPPAFNDYVDRAFAKLAEVLGIDPLELLPEREA